MNVLLVLCHPYERSLCAAIATRVEEAAAATGVPLTRRDLYSLSFDPVLSGAELARRYSLDPLVQELTAEVQSADHIVIVHPDWWSGPPAMLKGWIDRVFRPGIAYDWVGEEFTRKHHEPLLGGKDLSVFYTTDKEFEVAGIDHFWADVAEYSGMRMAACRGFTDVRNSSFRSRREWLGDAESHVKSIFGRQP